MLRQTHHPRRGAAVVEAAILLPLLAFLFVIGTDFARVYNPAITLMNCARNGAMYGSQSPTHSQDDNAIRAAALADAVGMSPQPTVAIRRFTEGSYPYVEVSVSAQFKTVTNYPGVPSPLTLTRTVKMRVTPATPQGSTF